MYKVFMNDKPIIITESIEESNNFEVYNFDAINFDKLQERLLESSVHGVYLQSSNLAKDWSRFQENFRVIEAAGGKVYNSKSEILFIYRFDKWDLPKGHIEKGEKREVAAVREVEEECGIEGLSVVKRLETTYHAFSYNEELRLKVTYWFEMKTEFEGELIPQTEEGITNVCFKNSLDIDLALKNTYPNIKLLF